MKRGISQTVETTIERRVTYSYTLADVRNRLRLDGAAIFVMGEELKADSDEVFQAVVEETK